MPGIVRPHKATWFDKAFAKDYKSLSKSEQSIFSERLDKLLEALRQCAHPVTDPALQRWRPSAYRVAGRIEGRLVEYRFPGTVRVIACYFEEESGQVKDTILLVAVTLKHDHDRLKRLIEGQKAGLQSPPAQAEGNEPGEETGD